MGPIDVCAQLLDDVLTRRYVCAMYVSSYVCSSVDKPTQIAFRKRRQLDPIRSNTPKPLFVLTTPNKPYEKYAAMRCCDAMRCDRESGLNPWIQSLLC
jgi:hypothetical protein